MGWGRESWRKLAVEVRYERSSVGRLLYSDSTDEVASVKDSLSSEEATLTKWRGVCRSLETVDFGVKVFCRARWAFVE